MAQANGHRIAFLILCHADAPQVRRLVNALDWCADFFIHVDAKADFRPFASLVWPSNVRFVSDRVSVRWGGMSMVRATIATMDSALSSGCPYSRLVLLSGACFPIKPVGDLHVLFAANPKQEFIRLADLSRSSAKTTRRVNKRWLFDVFDIKARHISLTNCSKIALRKLMHVAAHAVPKLRPTSLHAVEIAVGSQWWANTPALAKYLIEQSNTQSDMWRFFSSTLAPDELYFHTLVRNSPFFPYVSNWLQGGCNSVAALANLHIIDPSLQRIFDHSDFDSIVHSEEFGVRKIDSQRSAILLRREDELLTRCNSNTAPILTTCVGT